MTGNFPPDPIHPMAYFCRLSLRKNDRLADFVVSIFGKHDGLTYFFISIFANDGLI